MSVRVSTVDIHKTARSCIDIAKEIRSEINTLDGRLSGPLHRWQGAAKTEAINAWGQVQKALGDLSMALRETGEKLEKSGRDYATTDQDRAQELRSSASEILGALRATK